MIEHFVIGIYSCLFANTIPFLLMKVPCLIFNYLSSYNFLEEKSFGQSFHLKSVTLSIFISIWEYLLHYYLAFQCNSLHSRALCL